jgi:excisionase family DNA binding protein
MNPENATPPTESLLTADEVAALLQVTTPWVYAQTRAGLIPHVALGRYKRYRRSAIEDWLMGIEHEPPSVGVGALSRGRGRVVRFDPSARSSPRRGTRR